MLMEGGGVTSISELHRKIVEGEFLHYAILIYSDADKNFVTYIKEAHDALALMSGEKVFVFWFEHFKKDAKLLWKPRESFKTKPKLNRSESLRLAKYLGIPMTKTPCILLCKNLEDTGMVVYSFDNAWPHEEFSEHFKSIFDIVEGTLREAEKNPLFNMHDAIEEKLTLLKAKKWVKRVSSRESIGNLLKSIAQGVSLTD